VYDGHGGRAAVDLIADKLGKNIVAALAAASLPEEGGAMAAIRAGYLTTDSEFLSQVGAHAHQKLDFLHSQNDARYVRASTSRLIGMQKLATWETGAFRLTCSWLHLLNASNSSF
jgi:protein phosphatase 1L